MLVISMPPLPLGPQPHVHLVEPAGRRMHREQMHHPLRKRTKNTWLSTLRAPCGLLRARRRVVQEHHIQIRAIAEFDAAELAVADRADRAPRAAASPSPHMGTPTARQICASDSSRARSMISSAMSVSRSLTGISGRPPGQIRHANAEHARPAGNCAARSTCRSSSPACTSASRALQFRGQLGARRATARTAAHRSAHRAAAAARQSAQSGNRRSRRARSGAARAIAFSSSNAK